MNELFGGVIGALGTVIGIFLGTWLYYRWVDYRDAKKWRDFWAKQRQEGK